MTLCTCGHKREEHRYNTYLCCNECNGKLPKREVSGLNGTITPPCSCKEFTPQTNHSQESKRKGKGNAYPNLAEQVETPDTSNSNNINKKILQHSQDNTNFFTRKLKEIEKGCGDEFIWISLLNDKRKCGQIEDLKHSDNILLCDICKAQKQILLECMNEVRKAIDEILDEQLEAYPRYKFLELRQILGISEEDSNGEY